MSLDEPFSTLDAYLRAATRKVKREWVQKFQTETNKVHVMDFYASLCIFLGLVLLPAVPWHVRRRRQRLLIRLQDRNRRWSARFREDAANFHDEIGRELREHWPDIAKETGSGTAFMA